MLGIKFIIVVFLVSGLSAFCFQSTLHAGGIESSSTLNEILSRHKHWQTVVYQYNDIGGSILQGGKKWEIQFKKSGTIGMYEQTQLTPTLDTKFTCQQLENTVDLSGYLKMVSGIVEPASLVSPRAFLSTEISCQPDAFNSPPRLRELDHERFVLEFRQPNAKTPIQVIFFPALTETGIRVPVLNRKINLWTAPLGPLQATVSGLLKVTIQQATYLYHDLNSVKTVKVDRTFPKEYVPVLKASLSDWNQALDAEHFIIESKDEALDSARCLSENSLCLFWHGPKHIGWAGVGCSTTLTFDPTSGAIFGGQILCNNTASENLVPTPPDIVSAVTNSATMDTVAGIYLRRSEFLGFEAPRFDIYIGYILRHEIGHFLGMSHNFLGRNGDLAVNPYDSIMDYPSFPLIAFESRIARLGRFDLAALDLVYRIGGLPSDYKTCGDEEADFSLSKAMGLPTRVNCNRFDLKSPIEWLKSLVNSVGSQGILATNPGEGKLLLDQIGRFLLPDSGASASDVALALSLICKQSNDISTIRAHLKSNLEIELPPCPAP